jgi:hypothetical protein
MNDQVGVGKGVCAHSVPGRVGDLCVCGRAGGRVGAGGWACVAHWV